MVESQTVEKNRRLRVRRLSISQFKLRLGIKVERKKFERKNKVERKKVER